MLISTKPGEKKIQFRIRLMHSIVHEIEAYCQWAGIHYRDYFIQQACEYIFKKDQDWLNHKEKNSLSHFDPPK